MRLFKDMRELPAPLVWLAAGALRLWAWSFRRTLNDPAGVVAGRVPTPYILVIWHNRMVFAPLLVPRRYRARVVFLASRSRDGGYISQVLTCLGMAAVRGSSSRGGAEAARQLSEILQSGRPICVTPDGPRGPRYVVQDGALWLAQRCGVPIIPAAVNAPSHWEMRSWDRTQIPKPFTRVELVFGPPIPPPADQAAVPAWRAAVLAGLQAISRHDHPAPPLPSESEHARA